MHCEMTDKEVTYDVYCQKCPHFKNGRCELPKSNKQTVKTKIVIYNILIAIPGSLLSFLSAVLYIIDGIDGGFGLKGPMNHPVAILNIYIFAEIIPWIIYLIVKKLKNRM